MPLIYIVDQANLYYFGITCTIDTVSLTIWKHAVKVAEQQCNTDLKVMNIYAAHIPDCHEEELVLAPVLASRAVSALIDQWTEHLLVVEETQ